MAHDVLEEGSARVLPSPRQEAFCGMITLFFPSPVFGWCFTIVLAALLGVAAVVDFRTMRVPKRWVLVVLVAGVVATLLRGALLGAAGELVWVLGKNGPWVGMLDAFLLALCGVLVGFFVTTGLWILGVCGGGDVKLTAAVGAWLGPVKILLALLVAVCVVVVLLTVRMAPAVFQGQVGPGRKLKSRLVTFSLPLAVGTVFLLAAALGNDQIIADIARMMGAGGAGSNQP
jgi:Flp pilus assembly protein protease CpaA